MNIQDPVSIVNINDFFGCMLGGDLKIKDFGKKNIILMGQSMIGKSTLFNYIIGQKLVGKKIRILEVVYEKKKQASKNSIGHNPSTSETLLPNIHPNLSYSKTKSDVGLVDMAGFNDRNRSYRGVFTVSYMLESVFEKTEQFKIILVTHGLTLSQSAVKQLKKPFMGLIQILKVQNSHELSSFYQCVALVVTKAKIEDSKQNLLKAYDEKLNIILRGLEDEKKENNGLDKEDQILYDLVKSIKDNKRIEIFEQAIVQKSPKQCKIMEDLSNKKWAFFDFKRGLGTDQIFRWPFKQQKDELRQKNREKYQQYQQQKKKSIQESYKVLSDFVQRVNGNWKYPNLQNPGYCFQGISQVLQNNHYFKQDQSVKKKRSIINNYLQQLIQNRAPQVQQESLLQSIEIQTNKQEKLPKKGLQLINTLESIDRIVQNIEHIEENNRNKQHREAQQSLSSIEQLQINILKLFLKFKEIICGTQKEEESFLEFIFVNIRALRQSSIITKIDESEGSSIQIAITDCLKKLLGSGIENIKEKFMQNFQPETEDEINQFSQELHRYLEGIQQKPELASTIRIRQVNMIQKKGKIQFEARKYQEAIQKYLEAMECLGNLQNYWRSNNQYGDSNQNKIEKLARELYQRIAESFQKRIQKKGGKSLTIDLIHQIIVDIYRAIIAPNKHEKHLNNMLKSKCLTTGKKRDYLIELARFQRSYGRKEAARITYQKILDDFYEPQNKQIKQQMYSLPEVNLSNVYERIITIDTALNARIREKLSQLKQSK